MNLVLFGVPGSGKGTQAERLSERFSLKHISTGDLLRGAVSEGTDLGRAVEGILAAGELVSDEIVLALIRKSVADVKASGDHQGWILDGFPRTLGQAEGLEVLLGEAGEDIDAVVVLDVDRQAIIDRLLGRGRADDNEETVAYRLDVYAERTAPILGFYEGKQTIHRIDGNGTIEEITEAIERVLQ